MARGRKPIDRTALVVAPVVVEPVERTPEQILADRFEQLQRGYAKRRSLADRLTGRIEMAEALTALFAAFGGHVTTSEIAKFKENKLYREMYGQETGDGHQFSGTWEEFCEHVLKRSREQVDEDIRNLKSFGERALDAMERANIGYRQLRDLRRLPADDREAVVRVAETEDKEALLDVVESLVARKAASDARADATEQALKDAKEVHRRLMADKAEALHKAQTKAETLQVALNRREQLERSNPDERLKALTGELSGMAAKLAFELRNNLGRAIQTVREVGEEHGITVDDACAAALGMVRRALSDTEEDLGVSLSVRYPAWSYPDKEIRTPDLGQVYGESDHERVEREFAETAAFAAAHDDKDTYRQTIAWMRAQGHSEEEIRATNAWHELFGAEAAPAEDASPQGAPSLDSAVAPSLDSAVAPSLDSAVAPSLSAVPAQAGRLRVVGGGRGE